VPGPAAVRVAVCANRVLPVLHDCLTALAAQLEDPADLVVVASGSDPALQPALAEAIAASAPGARLVREPRSGLSRARNRALAECADGDVLAYVDDDVVAPPGWLAALRAGWSAGGGDLVCLGGPVRLRFESPRPGWLGATLEPVLSGLDYGPQAADLDPAVRTVYGCNASFRCGALRAVGGFDPAFGHRAGRDFFSEEDEAERALHRAGGRIRYEPAAWVEHVIGAPRLRVRWFLERRFRYGATLGLRRARGRGTALRQALRSAGGAPLALARGDRAGAVERAVRAAENAGVLAAPLLARR
jgi:glycosyltransferase involved in cell wall biosynthesis